MTKIKYVDNKAVIYKNREKHYFRKFEGFGIQIKDLIEITKKVKKIAIVIENAETIVKYTTPQTWLDKGIAWRFEQKGKKPENQIILPEKYMK